jgi:D-alanyl-D-alanine carboxypeptidase
LKYSNLGFGLLGLAIEAIAGEAHGVWIKRMIGLMARGHSGKLPGDNPTNALAPATGFVRTAGGGYRNNARTR